ncbi:Bug family tripartite tricarboxylate transporter substrate binding protein [Diaphorobacter caeni]|uniref:Bug family tripartite tricarboxylate transporter substrate binding protein n=1 Tax=Diaphorobacter caeni TaxID=2784387 RepID=UPI00188F214B|nr:tripartite tricarboxylate transporter substrate binding protein [Diaphorobacter caeni]MBF5004980.1 tripartite tricarboxylate transporter substrate binding protein [Diaphorobacter caeni]
MHYESPSLTRRHAVLAAALTAVAWTAAAPVAHAQDNADITRIIVGFAPGGAADSLARLYAEQLRQDGLGNIIVENKPGASSRLALDYVKKAPADGKTIFIGPSPMFTIFPLTYKKLSYDPDKDLVPVALLTDVPTVIATSVNAPYHSMGEYAQWLKKNPNGGSLGLASIGSAGHLGAFALSKELGITVTPTPYRGATPMLVDVVSGNVSMGWDAVASMMPLYKGGKLQFLGVSGTRRIKALPQVPTAYEQGFKQFEFATSWYGAYVAGSTSEAIRTRLQDAFIKASSNAATASKLEDLGLEVVGKSGADARERMLKERAAWSPIVKASGFEAQD